MPVLLLRLELENWRFSGAWRLEFGAFMKTFFLPEIKPPDRLNLFSPFTFYWV
jgi:hypothetical protein